eukprot:gnl/Chilomastix_cuspidata/6444.p1 GENE.gnl/Chilomastix_cuspidata/6444~~gnl/Chilomastix_cuspidata/6444.p1  ORF type:complete len:289 (-),score=69.56 gnl/Chilomastix_cuspidata/6444:87-953(-)
MPRNVGRWTVEHRFEFAMQFLMRYPHVSMIQIPGRTSDQIILYYESLQKLLQRCLKNQTNYDISLSPLSPNSVAPVLLREFFLLCVDPPAAYTGRAGGVERVRVTDGAVPGVSAGAEFVVPHRQSNFSCAFWKQLAQRTARRMWEDALGADGPFAALAKMSGTEHRALLSVLSKKLCARGYSPRGAFATPLRTPTNTATYRFAATPDVARSPPGASAYSTWQDSAPDVAPPQKRPGQPVMDTLEPETLQMPIVTNIRPLSDGGGAEDGGGLGNIVSSIPNINRTLGGV